MTKSVARFVALKAACETAVKTTELRSQIDPEEVLEALRRLERLEKLAG